MKIQIEDDFNPKKIIDSGQCFRCGELGAAYYFITGDHILYMAGSDISGYEVSCSAREWEEIWAPYFDLSRNYAAIRGETRDDPFLAECAAYSRGIRILKQDPWEALIAFIISQRKSIPAIRRGVQALAEAFGTYIENDYGSFYAFPDPPSLALASERALSSCGLGYRVPYVAAAAQKFSENPSLLSEWNGYSDEALFGALKTLYGVGDKIARCVMLFAYQRFSSAPVDTWINKISRQCYAGKNPFEAYDGHAGIIQQYAFYYAINHKNLFASPGKKRQAPTPANP